jgi:hypothetical protein
MFFCLDSFYLAIMLSKLWLWLLDDDADISIDDLNAKDEGGEDEFDDGGFDYDDWSWLVPEYSKI